MTLHYELSYIKQHYRDIFNNAHQTLLETLMALQAEFTCPQCVLKNDLPEVVETLHAGCGYKNWQAACLRLIEVDIGKDILQTVNRIETERNQVQCHQCGVCCKFASSEFSYDELLEKASGGDEFARQFTSVFLPYANAEAARYRFPDLVDSILKEVRLQQAEQSPTQTDTAPVHFYHCPYIGEDNRCTIYGTPKRPAICAGYPDTPLTFIYEKCAWKPWKDKNHRDSMAAHASIELCMFYRDKLMLALQ